MGLNANESSVSQDMVMLRNAKGDPIVENGKIIYSCEMTYDVRGKGIKNEHNEIIDYVVVQDHSYGHRYEMGWEISHHTLMFDQLLTRKLEKLVV